MRNLIANATNFAYDVPHDFPNKAKTLSKLIS